MIPVLSLGLIAAIAPPPEYDYPTERFYFLRRPSFAEVQKICAGSYDPITEISLGCTDMLTVYIPVEFEGELYDLIFRHEQAHLNGWRH